MWLKFCKGCQTFIQANFLMPLLQRLSRLVHMALKPQHLVFPMILPALAVLQCAAQVAASPKETAACARQQAKSAMC